MKYYKNYNEYLYSICNNVDYSSRKSVDDALATVAKEALDYHDLFDVLEAELKKMVTAEQFEILTRNVAKHVLTTKINSFEDEDVKEFALSHLDETLDMLADEENEDIRI